MSSSFLCTNFELKSFVGFKTINFTLCEPDSQNVEDVWGNIYLRFVRAFF